MAVYKDGYYSYRQLPLRWAELGTVYRYERSGTMHGLFRVRGFTQARGVGGRVPEGKGREREGLLGVSPTRGRLGPTGARVCPQDDAHIFCLPSQIESEILRVLDLVEETLTTFGFTDYEVNLSTRPEKSVGEDEIWTKAEAALTAALERKGWKYQVDVGGGAFYGPKIDIKIFDAIGRKWQCSTIQLDFNLPERFGLEYVGEDSNRLRPIMIHRRVLLSLAWALLAPPASALLLPRSSCPAPPAALPRSSSPLPSCRMRRPLA